MKEFGKQVGGLTGGAVNQFNIEKSVEDHQALVRQQKDWGAGDAQAEYNATNLQFNPAGALTAKIVATATGETTINPTTGKPYADAWEEWSAVSSSAGGTVGAAAGGTNFLVPKGVPRWSGGRQAATPDAPTVPPVNDAPPVKQAAPVPDPVLQTLDETPPAFADDVKTATQTQEKALASGDEPKTTSDGPGDEPGVKASAAGSQTPPGTPPTYDSLDYLRPSHITPDMDNVLFGDQSYYKDGFSVRINAEKGGYALDPKAYPPDALINLGLPADFIKNAVDTIDTAFEQAPPLKEPLVVYRSDVYWPKVVDGKGVYDKTSYASTDLRPLPPDVGGPPDIKIIVPAGSKVLQIANPAEGELLLPPCTYHYDAGSGAWIASPLGH